MNSCLFIFSDINKCFLTLGFDGFIGKLEPIKVLIKGTMFYLFKVLNRSNRRVSNYKSFYDPFRLLIS